MTLCTIEIAILSSLMAGLARLPSATCVYGCLTANKILYSLYSLLDSRTITCGMILLIFLHASDWLKNTSLPLVILDPLFNFKFIPNYFAFLSH